MHKKLLMFLILFFLYSSNGFAKLELFRDYEVYNLLETSNEIKFQIAAYKYRGKAIRLEVFGKLEAKEEVADSFDLLPPVITCTIKGLPVSKLQSNVLLRSDTLFTSSSNGNWKKLIVNYVVDKGVDTIEFSCEVLYPEGAKQAYIKELLLESE